MPRKLTFLRLRVNHLFQIRVKQAEFAFYVTLPAVELLGAFFPVIVGNRLNQLFVIGNYFAFAQIF